MKYRIYLINHDYYSQDEFDSLDAAIQSARGKSFECVIYYNGKPVYAVGPFRDGAL